MEFQYYLTVDHVHDGDTIMGYLDMGLRMYVGRVGESHVSVRLAGVNAPELSEDGGHEARDYLRGLVNVGDVLRVVSHDFERDKYARIIGTVYSGDDNLNARMVQSGHAQTS
jgi:endonuclease YncB( thermonuclease family)